MGTPIRPEVPLSPAEQLRRAQEPKDTGIAPAERLRQARDLTRDEEPSRASRVLRVQGQSAFPTDFVERNLDVLEKEVNQPSFDADRFWKESPAVAQWLAKDPTRVAATGRDIQRMGSVERYLRAIGTEVERNKITTDLVEPGLAAMFGRATPEQETAIQTLRQRQAGLPNLGPEGFFAGIPVAAIGQLPVTLSLYKGAATGLGVGAAVGGAVGAVRGAPAGPAGAATGAVTGAARGAFLGSRVGVAVEGMKLETAMAFLDYRELPNVDRETAAVGAMVAGVVAGALELVPFEAASKTIPGLRRLGKEGIREMLMAPTTRGLLQKYAGHILTNMTAEGVTEGAQAMVTHVGKVLTQRAGDGTLSQLSPATLLRELFGDAEAWQGILAEARAGAQAGGGFATATQGVSTAVDFGAVRRAEQNASRMQAAAEAIHGNDREQAMTIAKDAPQAMQDAVASVGSDGAYFDINAFTSYWQSQTTPDGEAANPREVALALGVTAPEYDAALETQGTIRVLAERLLVDGMGSATHRQWFVDHLRSTPNELSRAEAQKRVAAMDAEIEAAPEVPSRVVEADAAVESLREKLTTEMRGARVQAQELEAGIALWTEGLRTAIDRNPEVPVADIVRRFERVQVVAQPVAAMPDGRAVSAYEVTNEKIDRGDGVQVPVLRSTRSARSQAARMQERLATKYSGDVTKMPEKERAQYEAVTQAALDAETLNKSLTPVDYATLRGPVVMGSTEQQAIVNVEADADVLEQAAFYGTDFLAQEAMPEQVTTGDLGTMNVARGQRVTADNVVLTADEEKAVASAVKDIKRLLPKLKPAMTEEDVAQYVREVKAAFPESDGWAPLEFKGLDASQTNKGNNGKIEYKWGNVSYSFNRALDSAQGLKVGTPEYEAQVTATANALVDEVRSVVARAKAGDVAAKRIIAQRGWYKNMRQRLRQEFGGLGDVFADLLGALSPNTPVRENWKNAVDFLRRATDGAFDELIPQWEAWSAKVTQEEIAFKAWFDQQLVERGMSAAKFRETPEWKARKSEMSTIRELPDNLIPTKANGKKYGFNGKNAVRATLGLWRVVREADVNIGRGGQAPKALNFSGNLIGFRKGATIDVWAARMLQRLTGRVRIPPPAEQGVGGEMRAEGTTTGAFGYGQDVFAQAAEAIRKDKSLGMPEMGDDDLQAVVWFVEKELWTKNNWTSAAGEGGSFEFEADLQGVAQGTEVDDLRRVMDSSKSTPEEREEAAAALTRLSRTVDRYTVGLSVQQAGGIQGVDVVPTDDAQSVVLQGLRAAIYATANPESVLATKAVSTEGRYFGDVERAVDVEAVVREGFDPTPLWREIVRVAQENNQDSAFLSRVLRAEETMDPMRHRPGIELYLSTTDTSVLEERIAAITEMLVAQDINGFTITMDGRATGAVEGKPGRPIGVRLQYVPEFDRRYSEETQGLTGEQIAAKLQERGDTMADLAVKLAEEVPDVSFAGRFFYETRVAFSHQYAEELANAGDDTATGVEGGVGPSARRWEGRLLGEGIAATDRQLGIARADAERQAQPSDATRRDTSGPEGVNFLAQGTGQEPRGAFIAPAGRIDGPRLVALFKEKNQTTFLHESAHAFLDLWTDLSNDPAASPQFRELVTGLRTELGATGTERLSVAQEEAFAGMFMDYAKTGKAPSLSLRQAFASFAAFLSKLWSFVKGEIVPANANVTDLLNRLLATDEAIEVARGEFMAPLFPADMEINAAFVKARTFAEEQTRAEAMRTIVRAEQEWWKRETKRVEEEVRERVAQDPAYIARQAFTALQNPDGSALPADSPFRVKLNKVQVVGILGDEATKALPRGKAGAVYATVGDGMDVGMAATALGYESASALLEAIRTTIPLEDHIKQVTDATMKERYGDPMTDGTIPEVAIEAVHNDALDQMRRLEIETIIRDNPTQFRDAAVRAASRPLNLRELKAWAESHIAQIPLKALRPQQYESAERKATKDAVRAVAEGKWAEAVQAKARQRMSAALYAEAIATRDRIAKAQKLFGKVLGTDEKIAARRNFDIVQAARQILASVGVGRKAGDTAFYLQQLAEYDPATAETLQGVVAELNVPPRDNLRDLSVEEFDAVAKAVDFLWRMSSDVNTLTIAGERVSKESVLEPMMDRLRDMKDSAVEGAGVERMSKWTDAANRKLLTVKAAGRRVESWADFMDGGDITGPFRGGLFQEVRDQTANKAKAQAKDLEQYEALVNAVRPHLAFSEIAAPELGRGKWVFKDTAHLLGALLHTGNASNFQMMLDGRGWSKDQWFAFRDRMVAEGKLVPAHFDFVQGVWNLFEDKKPDAQKVYRRMFGKYFAEITREGFAVTFPDGTTQTYAGGYTPASKDPDASTAAAKRTADAMLEEAYGMRFPTVQKGFTISRVQNAEPLLLSLDIVKKHLDATNKFIYLAEPVRQVGRLLRDREFRAEMDRVNPSLVNELLMPWLERSATQVVERPSGTSPLARMGDGVAKYMRTTAGAGFMFLNVANTLEQATGLSVAAVRVNPRYMSLAEANYLKDTDAVRGIINAASPFMDTRNTTQVSDVVRRIEVLTTNPNVFQKVQAFAQEHAYILQSAAQNHVDVIVWYGSYMESLDNGLAESDAVKKADADVRLTQGSFDAVDISAMESGTPWFRLVAMFAGYFNMLANLNATEMAKAVEQMGVKRSLPRLFTVYGLGFAVPMLASNLIRRGLMGRAAFGDFDGEDDWGYLDDWFAWFFGEQARGLTAMAPPAGSAVNFLVAQFDDKPFNDQLSVSPALSFVESAGRGVKANYDLFTGDPFQRRDVRDMLALFSLMTRVPATGFARPLTYLYDVNTGKAEPSGPVDFTRGLVSGQAGTTP